MNFKLEYLFIVLLWLAQFAPFTTHAEVYRWVDENGSVHFGDKPHGNPSAEKVEIKTSTVSKDANQQRRLKNQKHLLSVIEEERKIKQQKQAEKNKKKEAKKKNCKSAKKTLSEYLASGQLYDIDKEGNKIYLSDQEREEEIKNAKEAVKYWCK